MKVHITDFKFIIIGNGYFHHVVAIELMKQTFAWLQRILRRDNKPNFIDIRILRHDIGDGQMTDVNWVKRSEEEADFHFLFLKPSYNFCASFNDFSKSSLTNAASK